MPSPRRARRFCRRRARAWRRSSAGSCGHARTLQSRLSERLPGPRLQLQFPHLGEGLPAGGADGGALSPRHGLLVGCRRRMPLRAPHRQRSPRTASSAPSPCPGPAASLASAASVSSRARATARRASGAASISASVACGCSSRHSLKPGNIAPASAAHRASKSARIAPSPAATPRRCQSTHAAN